MVRSRLGVSSVIPISCRIVAELAAQIGQDSIDSVRDVPPNTLDSVEETHGGLWEARDPEKFPPRIDIVIS